MQPSLVHYQTGLLAEWPVLCRQHDRIETLPHSSVLEALVPAGRPVIPSPARPLLHHTKILIRYDDAKLRSWMFVLHYLIPKPASDPAVECNFASTSRTPGCPRPRHGKVYTLLTSKRNQLSANAIREALRIVLLVRTILSPPYISCAIHLRAGWGRFGFSRDEQIIFPPTIGRWSLYR